MNNAIIDHLFEFWEHIGLNGGFLKKGRGFKYTAPNDSSWPYKVYGIDAVTLNFGKLYEKMKNGVLPISLGIAENEHTEGLLMAANFEKTSTVKSMLLKTDKTPRPVNNFPAITLVDTDEKATIFARVASNSFGYDISSSTLTPLVKNNTRIRMYIGTYNNNFVSCGMIYLDKNGVSGIHLIGTLSKYRGLGLGKTMATKLLYEAYKNQSKDVVLVASASGEKIYSKIGFITQGALKSYSAKK